MAAAEGEKGRKRARQTRDGHVGKFPPRQLNHREKLDFQPKPAQRRDVEQPHRNVPPQEVSADDGPKKLLEARPLHPSWEAKRKLKEKEGAGIIPSKGKKIVFD
jgi:hypothetical protein